MELDAIEAVRSRLPEDAASRLQQQVATVNMVQRLSDGKEVNLYSMRGGRAVFDDTLRFPSEEPEALLGSVDLRHPEKERTLRVELWLANGRLFSLLYDKRPKDFFAGLDLRSIRPAVVGVSVRLDAIRPLPRSTNIDRATLTGWVSEWFEKGVLARLCVPLPEAERKERLKHIRATLPSDYLSFVSEAEGAVLESRSITIHGLAGIRKVVTPEANFYVLAEDEASVLLAVREQSNDGRLLFLHADSPRQAGTSFMRALEDWRSSTDGKP